MLKQFQELMLLEHCLEDQMTFTKLLNQHPHSPIIIQALLDKLHLTISELEVLTFLLC